MIPASFVWQALTFNKMAPMLLGRIDIQYRRVECVVPQDLNVIIDQNRGAGGWIRLQVKVRACIQPVGTFTRMLAHAHNGIRWI